jgi:hypothetical protein
MLNIQLPFDVSSSWLKRVLIIIIFSWMATYSIYTAFYRAKAVDTYTRFLDHRAGRSMFFNPWQYRVLCPVLVEGLYQAMDHTVFSIFPVHGIVLNLQGNISDKNENTLQLMNQLRDPEFVKHTIVFLIFRFLENILVFLLAYHYLAIFITNVRVRWLALIFVALAMGNTVVDSDLTFNTYMDVIVYLAVALVIMKNLNYWWVILLTIVGSLNRESSVFIPAIFFLSKVNWPSWPNFSATFFSDKKLFWITSLSVVLYFSIFFSIRAYYGYRPLETWRVGPGWPMLKLNLFSPPALKTYMEFFGLFAFLPIWAVAVLKDADKRLQILFLALVPAWFGLHLYSAIGFQTRLFLVPTILAILPIVFENVDKSLPRATKSGNI